MVGAGNGAGRHRLREALALLGVAQLRTLVRNAQAEKARNKPPRAYREIYQVLRGLMLPAQVGGDVASDADEDFDEEDE